MTTKSKLLLDSNELITLQTQLAVVVGDRAAIALQQIHYWCDVSQRQGKRDHYQDDQWWVYNTWAEWQENNFPFWSVSTVRRVFHDLESTGVVITRPHADRNKGFWITVNYGALEVLAKADGRTLKVRRIAGNNAGGSVQIEQTGSAQIEQTGLPKLDRGSVQIEQPTRDTENTRERDSETKQKRVDASEKTTPPSSKPKAFNDYDDVPKADRLDIIRAWATSLSIEPANAYSKEANHRCAAEIFRAGYRAPQVALFVKAKMQDDWWHGKTPTLSYVAEHMPAYLNALKPKPAVISFEEQAPLYPPRQHFSEEEKAQMRAVREQVMKEMAASS